MLWRFFERILAKLWRISTQTYQSHCSDVSRHLPKIRIISIINQLKNLILNNEAKTKLYLIVYCLFRDVYIVQFQNTKQPTLIRRDLEVFCGSSNPLPQLEDNSSFWTRKIDTLYVLSIKMCHLKCILNKETKNWRQKEEENIYSKVLLKSAYFSLEYFLQKLQPNQDMLFSLALFSWYLSF